MAAGVRGKEVKGQECGMREGEGGEEGSGVGNGEWGWSWVFRGMNWLGRDCVGGG